MASRPGFSSLCVSSQAKTRAVLWPVRLGQASDHGRVARDGVRSSPSSRRRPSGFLGMAGRFWPQGDGLTTCVLVEDGQMDGFAPADRSAGYD
jgi:hypothetical protein